MKGGMSGRTMYLIMLLILVILILALFYFAGNKIIEKLFLKGLK